MDSFGKTFTGERGLENSLLIAGLLAPRFTFGPGARQRLNQGGGTGIQNSLIALSQILGSERQERDEQQGIGPVLEMLSGKTPPTAESMKRIPRAYREPLFNYVAQQAKESREQSELESLLQQNQQSQRPGTPMTDLLPTPGMLQSTEAPSVGAETQDIARRYSQASTPKPLSLAQIARVMRLSPEVGKQLLKGQETEYLSVGGSLVPKRGGTLDTEHVFTPPSIKRPEEQRKEIREATKELATIASDVGKGNLTSDVANTLMEPLFDQIVANGGTINQKMFSGLKLTTDPKREAERRAWDAVNNGTATPDQKRIAGLMSKETDPKEKSPTENKWIDEAQHGETPEIRQRAKDNLRLLQQNKIDVAGVQARAREIGTKSAWLDAPMGANDAMHLINPQTGMHPPLGITPREAQSQGFIVTTTPEQTASAGRRSVVKQLDVLQGAMGKIFKPGGFFGRAMQAPGMAWKLWNDPEVIAYEAAKVVLATQLEAMAIHGRAPGQLVNQVKNLYPKVFPFPDNLEIAQKKLQQIRMLIGQTVQPENLRSPAISDADDDAILRRELGQ